jgi:hypothetical protein
MVLLQYLRPSVDLEGFLNSFDLSVDVLNSFYFSLGLHLSTFTEEAPTSESQQGMFYLRAGRSLACTVFKEHVIYRC